MISSEEFLDFVDRSSKVIERALDQEYDVLADYAVDELKGLDDDEDEGYASSRGRKGRRMKEVAQFYEDRWCRKRMISDINFSPKVCLLIRKPVIKETDKAYSFRSFSLPLTPRTLLLHKIPRAFSKCGASISIPDQNTPFTAPPTSSLPSSHRSILP